MVLLWTQRDKLSLIAACVFGTVFVSVLVLPPDRVLIGNQFSDYDLARFDDLVLARFTVVERMPLKGGRRFIYFLEPRRPRA